MHLELGEELIVALRQTYPEQRLLATAKASGGKLKTAFVTNNSGGSLSTKDFGDFHVSSWDNGGKLGYPNASIRNDLKKGRGGNEVVLIDGESYTIPGTDIEATFRANAGSE